MIYVECIIMIISVVIIINTIIAFYLFIYHILILLSIDPDAIRLVDFDQATHQMLSSCAIH